METTKRFFASRRWPKALLGGVVGAAALVGMGKVLAIAGGT